MKKISIALAFCLLLSCFASFAVAAEDFEVAFVDGIPCVKDEIVLGTNVFYDPDEYTKDEPVEFLGVVITKLEALFPCETEEELKAWQEDSGDYYLYAATVDGSISLQDAIDTLSGHETVIEAGLNEIVWFDEIEEGVFTAAESPIDESNVEEAKFSDYFVSPTFVITTEEDLDLSQFGGEEKAYLFGIAIEKIEKTESESGFSYLVTVDGAIPCSIVKRGFESAEGVSSVTAFSTYGNGDVNKDGVVDKFDYILVKRLCLGTYRGLISQIGISDINLDGSVDKFDYILIKRHVLGTYKIADEPIMP